MALITSKKDRFDLSLQCYIPPEVVWEGGCVCQGPAIVGRKNVGKDDVRRGHFYRVVRVECVSVGCRVGLKETVVVVLEFVL